MGLVKVVGGIGLDQSGLTEVEFLVDTGAFYSFVGPDFGARLGIEFPVITTVVLANNTQVECRVGVAILRLRGREGGIIVGSIDVPTPLLGASALETLGLKADPVDETVEEAWPFGPAALSA